MAQLAYGTRVAFSRNFLRSTGQYTGPDAPTHVGPWARGEVKALQPCGPVVLAYVHWDDGRCGNVNVNNLVATDRMHLEPV